MSPDKIRTRTLLITLFTFLLATAAVPEEKADAADERLKRGGGSYRVYCMNCHGRHGEGDGPIAELLKVEPTDLTRLALANDGTFPADRIHRVIDGRDEIRGHGSREMPIWGLNFQDPQRDSAQEEEVRERIRDLVAFLRSLQVDK